MTADDTHQSTRGDDLDSLASYVREHRAGGYAVDTVAASVCAHCGGRAFAIGVDDEAGCAERLCLACDDAVLIADSADHWTEAEPVQCECPCGGEEFEIAVGFASVGDGSDDVRWVSVGLRCLRDGTLGVYTDWKIDYSPSAHLRGRA
ncbi:hypothetical protein [Rhodococcus gannanensis]|uniref:Uncharacterized protein n=1 Tax=Rhodococcus gannanensis TaxID=1960308 RepID=A0ABW4PD03_9NOCA